MGILDKIGLKRDDDIDDFINMPNAGPGVGAIGPAGRGSSLSAGTSVDTLPAPAALPSSGGGIGGQSNQMLMNKIDLLTNKIDTLRSQLDILNQKLAQLQTKLSTQTSSTTTQQQSAGYGQQSTDSFGGFGSQQQQQPQQQPQQPSNWQSPW